MASPLGVISGALCVPTKYISTATASPSATVRTIRVVTAMAGDKLPEEWRNGVIMYELIAAGQTREEALVRIGLFTTNKERFGA